MWRREQWLMSAETRDEASRCAAGRRRAMAVERERSTHRLPIASSSHP